MLFISLLTVLETSRGWIEMVSTKLLFSSGLLSGLIFCNMLLMCLWIGNVHDDPILTTDAGQRERRQGRWVTNGRKNQQNRLRGNIAYHLIVVNESEWKLVSAASKTWGKLAGSLYVHAPNITPNFLAKLEMEEPLKVKSYGSADKLLSSVLDQICEEELDGYQWWAIVAPTTYVLVQNVLHLLEYLDHRDSMWLGRPYAVPKGEGTQERSVPCHSMGSLISEGLMKTICRNCWAKSAYVEMHTKSIPIQLPAFMKKLAECTNMDCYGAQGSAKSLLYMHALFYVPHNYLLLREIQEGKPDQNHILTSTLFLSNLEKTEHFMNFYCFLVNSSRSVQQMQELSITEEISLVRRLLKAYLPISNREPIWLSDRTLPDATEGTASFGLINWHHMEPKNGTSFTLSKHHPIRKLTAAERISVNQIYHNLPLTENDSISDIYSREDHLRGIDYLIRVNSVNKNKDTVYHMLREFNPLAVKSVETLTKETKVVHFVISAPLFSKPFQRFIMTFENSFLAIHSKEYVALLVVVYHNDNLKMTGFEEGTYPVTTVLQLYKKKYPHSKIEIVTATEQPSTLELARIASAQVDQEELIFLGNVNLDIAVNFPKQCRLHVKQGEGIYAPIPYIPDNTNEFTQKRLLLPVMVELPITTGGHWLKDGGEPLMCAHNADLKDLLIETDKGDENILDTITTSKHLVLFKTVDPSLVLLSVEH